MFSLQDIVTVAIKIEENGEQTYRQAAARVNDSRLAELLGELANQEAEHAQWFVDLGGRVKPVEVDEELAGMGEKMLSDIVGEETFSLADADLSASGTLREIVDSAIELERDTVIFYEMVGSMLSDPQIEERLQQIIDEEKSHERRLMEYLDSEPG